MKTYGIAAVVIGLLLFSGTAWADGQTGSGGHSAGGHGSAHTVQPSAKTSNAAEDAKSHNMTPEQHSSMNTGGAAQNSSGQSTSSHDQHGTGGTSGASDTHDTHGTNPSAPQKSAPSVGHSHGSGAEVVETPPNAAVLGTFGGIMAAFIVYGAIVKYGLKKGRVQA